MSPPVTYLPAYVGLFASLVLAVACNSHLDIQYGAFAVEMTLWSAIFLFTLAVAWRQRGRVSDHGLFWQKLLVVVGLLATFLLFMPTWGLPRAGLYALAALQAAANCVTVDRRKFMMALMASAVMVIFATMHFRADWTMLFYLLPYLFAVVFTLVAEQVSRRARELHHDVLGQQIAGGQGASILAATTVLLAVALVLFALTPQVTWLSLKWKYGQPSNIGLFKATQQGADGGGRQAGGAGGASGPSGQGAGADGQGGGDIQDFAAGQAGQSLGDGYRESLGRESGWPTPKEMRQAAKRKGMPAWQAASIRTLADVVEQAGATLRPLQTRLDAAARQAAKWLEANRQNLIRLLAAIVVLALLAAAGVFFRELRPGLWLRMQLDYLRFGLCGLDAGGKAGALQYFGAMERLFVLHDAGRDPHANAREYLASLERLHQPLRQEAGEMTRLFEQARYGRATVGPQEVARMRQLYRRIYRSLQRFEWRDTVAARP